LLERASAAVGDDRVGGTRRNLVRGSRHAGRPWVYARRVVCTTITTFYNPTQHPFFDQDGGRRIYFEGTYTASFSGAKEKTPRYDYNQIMYRLALDDSRLNLPVPVYRVNDAGRKTRYLTREASSASDCGIRSKKSRSSRSRPIAVAAG